MGKRFKKLAAVVLASAMLLQNGAVLLAEEDTAPPAETTQTEAPTEKPTEPPTEKPTEAPTEAPTEPPTEPPTEKPTEAPTEKPTEAPAQTATEAPAEKPAEKSTEAPAGETERSERENDGKSFSASDLVGKLERALNYLLVAENIEAKDEILKEQEFVEESEATAVLDGLKKFSLKLANAKDSDDVKVINLYADESGALDTAQLDELFADQVIDVTKQYFVVNVIADSADQALSFSGYKMKLNGSPVKYEEGTEPGDIVYNFAALDGEGSYVDYTGELSLNNADGLQGTFLAPAAKVTLKSGLAGAVFAQSVTVEESANELLQISFATGREPVEEDKESEPETTDSQTQTDKTAEPETQEGEEPESEPETSEFTPEELAADGLPMPIDAVSTTLNATFTVKFNGHTLNALYDTNQMYEKNASMPYVSLFTKDETNGTYNRVESVSPTKLNLQQDMTNISLTISGDLDSGTTYYLRLTDEEGAEPSNPEETGYPVLKDNSSRGEVSFTANATELTLDNLILDYGDEENGEFPSGFCYPVTLKLTKTLLDSKGASVTGTAPTFYANLYTDPAHTQKVFNTPITLEAGNSVDVTLQATDSPMTWYLAETDESGNTAFAGTGTVGSGNDALHFSVKLSVESSPAESEIKVNCPDAEGSAPVVSATIENKLNAPVVKVGVVDDGSKKHLSGVKLVIKDEKGKIVQVIGDSQSTDQIVNGLATGATYYLSEVSAPSGYVPAKDVRFTVEDGKELTVQLVNKKASSTDYKLTVNKQVYCGSYQLYADPKKSESSRTFYFALFETREHIVKVSDVMSLTMSGMTGSVTFPNLTHNASYCLAETDEYGDPHISGHSIEYEGDGTVKMDKKTRTTVVRNVYTSVPTGFRYTATLTVTKHVTSASGAAKALADETFYVGIYKDEACTQRVTTVTLNLKNAAAASKRQRITFGNTKDPSVTYYFAEVDKDGNRLDSNTFGYNVSIDHPSMTIKRGEDKTVIVTNQEKSSKATLYLTKRVYEGTALKPVTDTFYVGLFKDAKFTKLYVNPIPMQLQNQSELTLKLSLDLGAVDKATIYLAETDQNGRVIRNESQFGYNIRAINSTAVFTQQRREIQTIFLNSVYGSATDEDWKQILSDENNQPAYGGSDGWVGGNGEVDPNADTVAAQTDNRTPIGLYISLLAVSAVVLILLLKRRRDASYLPRS